MNRKWLAGFTLCVLVAGLTVLRAHSQEPSQPEAQSTEPPPAEWIAAPPGAGPVDVVTAPAAPEAFPVQFPDPGAGDVFYLSTDAGGPDAGPETIAAFAGPPVFGEALPFPPPPGPQEGGVAFIGPDPQDNITFVGFEAGLGNQAVAGAPYSATVTSQFEQTLPDGNKIERKTTTTVYRDGQGRTRREQSLPQIGQYSASTIAPKAIFINDPVAGVTYVLEPNRKIARKMSRPKVRFSQALPKGPGRGGPQANNGLRRERRRDADVTTESLGTKNIDGILVEGTRVTRTIPAGRVGNQNPIQITSERWYSPELKVNLLVKNTDPMRGTNTTTLSDISRAEPDASLFQVPSDYTVKDAPRQMMIRRQRGGGPPPPPQQ